MKLYLSSEGIGNRPDDLVRMAGPSGRVAVVANAVDHYDKYVRETRVRKEKQRLRALGLEPKELDLRNYFGDPEKLHDHAMDYGMIWCRGGNAFNLRRAMIHSGFDDAVLGHIKEGDIAYGGFSAAITVAAPDLFGSELVNDPYDVPTDYPSKEVPIKALGLVEYHMAPHYETDMPWRDAVLEYIRHLRNNGRTVNVLRDGDVHLVERELNEGEN